MGPYYKPGLTMNMMPEVPPPEHVEQVCEPHGCQRVRLIYNTDDPGRWFCVGMAEKGPEANPDDRIFLCISTRDTRTGEPSRFTFHMNKADIAVLVHMLGEVLAVALLSIPFSGSA